VYAIDLWEEGLVVLQTEAEFLGLHQLKVLLADICANVPLEDRSADLCFLANTVLHDLARKAAPRACSTKRAESCGRKGPLPLSNSTSSTAIRTIDQRETFTGAAGNVGCTARLCQRLHLEVGPYIHT
jgi:hypothetical protein